MSETAVREVIVIGSGPSGYTAATYLARATLAPLVFEGAITAGGALMQTTEVENFPGFPDGVMGPELMENMRAQAEKFGAEFITDDVTEVDLTSDPKVVKVGDETYLAKSVVVATGSAWRRLGVDREEELLGRGVSACATCDGFFFRQQEIVVVGGGDTAMEEATFLTRFASKVTLVHRRDSFRASKVMQQRVFDDPKIEVAWNTEVAELLGDKSLDGLLLRDTVTGEERKIAVTGLFVAIGHVPRSDLFIGQLAMDAEGYLDVAAPSTRTNIEGVFAAGDVVDHVYRQAITAAGTGCAAALDAERWLADIAAADAAAPTPGAPAPSTAEALVFADSATVN